MRIAIVNSIRAYGGGEKWVLRCAGQLARRGHALDVCGHPGGALAERCAAEGIPFRPVRMRHDVSPAAVAGLARALRAARPDVVVCCNERAARVGAVALALGFPRRGVPLVYRNGLEGSFKNKAYNRLVVAPRVARFVANAEAVRRELLAFGWIPPERLEVIYNGVDAGPIETAEPAGLREQLGAAPGDVVILSAARLVAEKRHDALLRALAALGAAGAGVRAWIAGDGPRAAALAAQAEELGLGERVRLLGFRADVPRLLRAADVLCHPSRREGAPNVVLEAMAAGLPVVGADASGTAELVAHGRTGLLSPPEDEQALQAHLRAVVADPELRRRLGEAGRERVRAEFSEERSADRWEALLAGCAAGAGGGAA